MNHNIIQKSLDYYRKFEPSNYLLEKEKFFKKIEQNQEYNPQFEYNDNLLLNDYEKLKIDLKKDFSEDKIINEFLKLYDQVVNLMIAWKKQDYSKITLISGKLFGSYKLLNLEKAIKYYQKIEKELSKKQDKKYTDQEIKKLCEEKIFALNLGNWKIKFIDSLGSEIQIYETKKEIYIKTGATISDIEAEYFLTHEIEAHAFQGFNGLENKKYKDWYANYACLGTEMQYEEIAVFTEINNLKKIHIFSGIKRRLLYMIATAIAKSANFYQVYQQIYKLCNDQEKAFISAYKVKRGFQDTSKKGCFQKENSYLLGVLKVIELIEKDEKNYNKLMQGFIPFSVLTFINNVDIKWKGIKNINKKNINFFKKEVNKFLKI